MNWLQRMFTLPADANSVSDIASKLGGGVRQQIDSAVDAELEKLKAQGAAELKAEAHKAIEGKVDPSIAHLIEPMIDSVVDSVMAKLVESVEAQADKIILGK